MHSSVAKFERVATNHPGAESFDGELARFLVYERPLGDAELTGLIRTLAKQYRVPVADADPPRAGD